VDRERRTYSDCNIGRGLTGTDYLESAHDTRENAVTRCDQTSFSICEITTYSHVVETCRDLRQLEGNANGAFLGETSIAKTLAPECRLILSRISEV